MTNLSKQKRDAMIAFLEQLKEEHSDDKSIRAFNEIENHLREKKYGLVWEEHSEEVDDLLKENIPVLVADKERRLCKDENLPWNFIIEGDNLQALYLLEKTHKGKIDCIYIDPPYNTGARDWKYNNDYVDGNDSYRHSKWLSMMKNRLMIAKELLNPENSVLICTIDEKEYLHLGCLLEELFPDARIQKVTDVINLKGVHARGGFARVEEYIYYVFLGSACPTDWKDDMLSNEDASANLSDDVLWASLLRRGSNSKRSERPKMYYPILIDEKNNKVVKAGDILPLDQHPSYNEIIDGYKVAWPVRTDMSEGHWSLNADSLNKLIDMGYVSLGAFDTKRKTWAIKYLFDKQRKQIESGDIQIVGFDKKENHVILRYSGRAMTKQVRTVWYRRSHDAGTYGSTFIANILCSKRFTFPKSLYSEYDTIGMVLSNKKDSLVLDFFAGSGTTGHAVNLLNKLDNGNRRFILVTNNEISETEAKEFEARGIHKGDKEWEEKGIAKYVTWPRTVCSINGIDIKGEPLKGDYLGSNIPMADGFEANVKFFKCEWTPRKPENYLLSNALGLHIKEMIELQNAIEIDNVKNVLILNKDDFNKIILNNEVYEKIENIWLNQNIVLNAKELKLLQAKGFKYIPREFFGQELRENAE